MVTRTLILLLLLTLSVSAQTPYRRNMAHRNWFVNGLQGSDGSVPQSFLSIQGAVATNVNGVVWGKYLGRSAALFSSTGQNSYLSAAALSNTAPPVTFAGWLCITNNQQQYDGIIGARVGSTTGIWVFLFAQSNKITFMFNNSPAEYDFAGGPTIPLNKWVLVAAVLQTNYTRLVSIGSTGFQATNITINNTPRTLTGRVDIGYDSAAGRTSNMQGWLADWCVYRIALRDEDLKAIYRGVQ
jgi:hypothetical protein